MNIDIKIIDKIEKRQKIYTKQQRTIYEVIQQELFDETYIFPYIFSENCKNTVNEAHNISIGVKNNMNQIALEQGLYAQVIMLS